MKFICMWVQSYSYSVDCLLVIYGFLTHHMMKNDPIKPAGWASIVSMSIGSCTSFSTFQDPQIYEFEHFTKSLPW